MPNSRTGVFADPMSKRDYTDTVRDLQSLLLEEVRKHPRNDDLVKRILKSVEELADEIKEQRTEIINLRLKAEHLITRDEVHKIAAEAVQVTRERIDNLIKWVAASQGVITTAILFIANKVFNSGH